MSVAATVRGRRAHLSPDRRGNDDVRESAACVPDPGRKGPSAVRRATDPTTQQQNPPDAVERDLAAAFRQGDQMTLRAIYDRYGPLVYGIARACLPTAADAEDVTQATF